MSTIQMCYASAALVAFSPDDLKKLLDKARAKNQNLEISGLLIFHDGSFLQFLEGEPEKVQQLYNTIEADKRHGEVRLIMRREIEARNFGDWKMGFCRADAGSDQTGFIDILRSASTSSLGLDGDAAKVERVIDGFKDGRWRQKVQTA